MNTYRRFAHSMGCLMVAMLAIGSVSANLLIWSPTSNGNWNDPGRWDGATWNSATPDDALFGNDTTYTYIVTLDGSATAGTVDFQNDTGKVVVEAGPLTVNTSVGKTGEGTAEINGGLHGSAFTSVSAGTLTITSSNTFSGGVTINVGGTYNSGNASSGTGTSGSPTSGPFGTGLLTINGGVLASGAPRSSYNNVVINGDFVFSGSGAMTFLGATVDLGDATRTLTVDATHNIGLVFSGVVQASLPDVGVTKGGVGKLTFKGNNTYTGPTTVNGGTLVLDFSAAGNCVDGDLTINSGTVSLNRNNQIADTATVTASGDAFGSASRSEVVKSLVYNAGTLNFGTSWLALGSSPGVSGLLVVNDLGVLGGTGQMPWPVVVNAGGMLTPGDGGAGTLSLTNGLDLASLTGVGSSKATLAIELGATCDKLVVASAFTGCDADGVVVDLIDLGSNPPRGTPIPILDWTGAAASGVELADFALGTVGESLVGASLSLGDRVLYVTLPLTATLIVVL